MPKNGAYILADVAAKGLKQMDVVCAKCDRSGRVSVARLIVEHGPEASLPNLPKLIAASCPRMARDLIYDQCGALFENLEALDR